MLALLPYVIAIGLMTGITTDARAASVTGAAAGPVKAGPLSVNSLVIVTSAETKIAPDQDRATQLPQPPMHETWRSEDGLFYVQGMVNGQAVRFLVDTGASMIVLTATDARRIGVEPAPSAFNRPAETAGGASRMASVTLQSVHIGPEAATKVPAVVAQAGLNVSLLGQNWLSHLASVTIEGDRMIFR